MKTDRVPANAVKHGVTSKKHKNTQLAPLIERFSSYISAAKADHTLFDLIGGLAEVQAALATVRLEKAMACSVFIVRDDDRQSTTSANGGVVFDRLLTLDEYERKLLSRRRRMTFALLLADEEARK